MSIWHKTIHVSDAFETYALKSRCFKTNTPPWGNWILSPRVDWTECRTFLFSSSRFKGTWSGGGKTQRHSRLKLYTIKLFDGESWSVEKTFYKCQGIVFIVMGSVYSSEYMQNVKNNLGIFVYMLRLSMSANDVSWVTLLGFSPKVKAAIDIISIHIVLNWTQILVSFS